MKLKGSIIVVFFAVLPGELFSGELTDEELMEYEVTLPDMRPDKRKPIIEKLLKFRDPRLASLFLTLLTTEEDSPEMQETMAKFLEQVASKELYEPALQLLDSESQKLQDVAIRIIARSGHPQAPSKLIELYHSGASLVQPQKFMKYIGESRSKEVLKFIKTLKITFAERQEATHELYEEWVLARVKLSDPGALPLLLDLYQTNDRLLSGCYASLRWNAPKLTRTAINRLRQNIARRERLKHRILKLLRNLPGELVTPFLELAMKRTDPPSITIISENILPLIKQVNASSFLPFLRHASLQLREVVCEGIIEVADDTLKQKLIQELTEMVRSPELNDRLLAVRMSFLLPKPHSVDILRTALRDRSRWVRVQAIRLVPVVDLEILKPELERLLSRTKDEREKWDITASLAGIIQ